ncbi:MAG TPA: YqjK family protein [Rhodocyclaceae bacterium]|nr:YqjK family protein [Rhodocyclaceae bacterium]
MNGKLLELALKKQRLQLKSNDLRERWLDHARGLQPLSEGVEGVGDVFAWLRRHPQLIVVISVVLLVARPRKALRWARRTFLAWQVWRKGRTWLSKRLAF